MYICVVPIRDYLVPWSSYKRRAKRCLLYWPVSRISGSRYVTWNDIPINKMLGEAVVFGLDSSSIAYVKEAAIIFSFYTAGVLIFLFAAWKWVDNTTYFKEEFVVVPNHVLLETGHAQEVKGMSPTDDTEGSATPPTMEPKA